MAARYKGRFGMVEVAEAERIADERVRRTGVETVLEEYGFMATYPIREHFRQGGRRFARSVGPFDEVNVGDLIATGISAGFTTGVEFAIVNLGADLNRVCPKCEGERGVPCDHAVHEYA